MKNLKSRNWFPCRVCRQEHQNPVSSTLCSLECHKQEVGITMREPLKIEIGDTVKIAESSQYYRHDGDSEGVVSMITSGSLYIEVKWDIGYSNCYDNGDLILIKKGKTMKEFTKSDLIKLAQTETVIVKYRDKSYRVFINKVFNGAGWALLDEFSDDLKCKNSGLLDVLSVYKASETRCLSTYLRGEHLTIVWERTEQTEAQKEMEELQKQITKAKDYIEGLMRQAEVLKGKL
jgi:hypothetical protein